MPKILVIDDIVDSLISIKAILQSYEPDFQVVTASSGMEGIDLARSERPDTILLDIQMPEMDGYEVCQQLRADIRTEQTPVIFLTANRTTTEDRIKGLEHGGDAYLFKPIDPAELIANVKVMLRIKAAEDAHLRQYETMVSASSDMQALLDKDLKYRLVNTTFARAGGKKPQDYLGLTPSDFIPQDIYESSILPHLEACLKGNSQEFEMTYPLAGAGEQILEIKLEPYYDDDSTPAGIILVSRNISAKKLIESKLVESERRLSKSEILGRLGNWEYDLDSKNIVWSDGVFELFGRDRSLGHPSDEEVDKYYSEADALRMRTNIQEVRDTGEAIEKFEIPVIRDDGEVIQSITSLYPVKIEDKVVKLFGILRDITDEKANRNALKQQQRVLTEAQKAAKLGAFEYLVQTNTQTWSDETFRIFERDKSTGAPSGTEGIDYVAVEYREEARQSFEKAVSQGIPENKTWEIVTAAGNRKWVRFISRPKYEGEEIVGVTGSIQDITSQKEAEKQIQEALLEAEHANEVKDQFVANISHEIRTPLNSILGFSDLFKLRYSNLMKEKDQMIFDYIGESSARLMKTVDSILNISMLTAGTITVHKEMVNLDHLATATINNLKIMAEKKDLTLTLIREGGSHKVFADKNCINSALINLIENAIKYTNEGSVQCVLNEKKGQACLSIIDTGIGIGEDYQQRIFEPYTQESEGFTKDFQGVGLGLALTKRYLDLNDVKLELESKKGDGTTFTLIFPKIEG